MTLTELTHDQKANPGTGNFNTISLTPASGKLYIALIESWLNSGTVNTPTMTGDSLTWNQIGTHATNTNLRLTAFYAYGSPTSGVLNIDHGGQTVIAVSWSIIEITGADITGNPIIQVNYGGDHSTNTGLTITQSAFTNSANMALGYVALQSGAAVTKGSSLTELSNFGGGVHTIEVEYGLNQTSIPWTWSSDSSFKDAMAMEIKTANVTTTQTILGKSRIGYITTKTLTALARITGITLRTIQGISNIRNKTLRTIQGKTNILPGVNKTITGKASIIFAPRNISPEGKASSNSPVGV